jgi:PAS domain S-box-containing protein
MAGFWRTAGTMTGTPTDLSTVPAAPVGIGRPPYPVSRFGWIAAGVAALGWLYAAVLGLFLLRASGHRSTLDDWVADWSALPIQLATLLLELGLLARRRGASDRWAWRCVVAFTALSPVATWVWNAIRPAAPAREELGGPDLIYLMDYWALTAAFAVWFLQVGGSFRSRRTWFDGITMVVVLLVALWSSILGPSLDNGTGAGISVAATFGYSVTLVCMMSMAALLCLQLPSLRGNVGLLLIVAAGLIDVAWELMWLASWLTNRHFVEPFYNYGDVLCFAALCSAVAATERSPPASLRSADPERRIHSFLPALAVLMAIALVSASVASTRQMDAWILVGLVVLCALMLITRQRSVREELRSLNLVLARRQADARLTELVRRSPDLIVVIDAGGRVTYASPAAQALVGSSPEAIHNLPAVDVFGPAHRSLLRHLLAQAESNRDTPAVTELRIALGAETRTYNVTAVDQSSNELIGGKVLTVTDVTRQRRLEREVLDAASRERMALSAQIHDGLGQELVGIAMLLQGAAGARTADVPALREHIRAAVGLINHAVGSARDLARGLSPVGVVRGSLAYALGRLVLAPGGSTTVTMQVEASFSEGLIDNFCADHLYRIAQEAVTNALRHSGCTRVDLVLRTSGRELELEIKDDGRGFGAPSAEHAGIGLRLMRYRAQAVGATLRLEPAGEVGTIITVSLPLTVAQPSVATVP